MINSLWKKVPGQFCDRVAAIGSSAHATCPRAKAAVALAYLAEWDPTRSMPSQPIEREGILAEDQPCGLDRLRRLERFAQYLGERLSPPHGREQIKLGRAGGV